MKPLKARVRNGRIRVDEPTDLPEGTEIHLTIADDSDDLDDREREALHAALEDGWKQARAGSLVPPDDLLEELDD